MTFTATAEGTWSNNADAASSGTYTVDEANSKIRIKILVGEGVTLPEPMEIEATYSDDGKTISVVLDYSKEGYIEKETITLTRQ